MKCSWLKPGSCKLLSMFQFISVYYGPAIGLVDTGVAYAAHIGGFVAGIVMISVLTIGHGLQRAFS